MKIDLRGETTQWGGRIAATITLTVTLICSIFSLPFSLSAQAQEKTEKVAKTEKAKTKLIVWGLTSGKETQGLDAIIAEFDKRNPDIEVSNLSMGAGNMNPQKLMTSIVGGVPPDVIAQDRFTIGDWASRETFLPLDDLIEKDKNSPDAIKQSDFYPASWNEARYKDKVYAIPTGIDDRMLLYNKTMFREAGLDPEKPPRTWEELKDAAVKLTKKNTDGSFDHIGFIPNFGNSWFYIYSWENGGEFMSPDGLTCTLAAPENVTALTYMRDVYDALGGYNKVSIFQTGFQSGEQDPFFTGKVAMVINGSWMIPNIARYAPALDFGVAVAPVPKARLDKLGKAAYITWIGGYSLAIPRGSQKTEAAWKFIKFYTGVEANLIGAKAQADYYRSLGRPFIFSLSANQKVNTALLKAFPPPNEKLMKAQEAYIDMLPQAKFRPVTFVGQKLWDGHVRAFERACSNAVKPEEALKEQQNIVQKELDRALEREKLELFNWGPPVTALVLLFLGAVGFGFWRVSKLTGKSQMARREAIAGYLMASPWIIGFIVFTLGPILMSFLLSFCDYDVLHPARSVGLQNYQYLFTEDRELLGKALGNALYLSAFGIPLGMATGLAIAMLLNMKVKGLNWYRTAFYVPSIVPAIASATLWVWILAGDPNKGLINALWKSTLGEWFHLAPPGWFGVAEWAKPGMIVQGLWGAGGGMILWLAGLQGVSPTLYEAADMDGASGWAKFRHITLPMLSPYIFFNIIMGTIGALQEFDRAYLMGGGDGGTGPLDSLLVPVLFLFNNAFRYFKMGYASAIAWVIFVIILLFTLLQWWGQKYWVHYEGDKR